MQRNDWIGKRFGLLTVLEVYRKLPHEFLWRCRCECGREKVARGNNVRSGGTRSCGCINLQITHVPKKHGLTVFGKHTVEYDLWARAKHRARDAKVSFDLLLSDVEIPYLRLQKNGRKGPQDNSPSLDRLHPELGYVKSNVRVINYRANLLKSNATPCELRLVADWLERELHGVRVDAK